MSINKTIDKAVKAMDAPGVSKEAYKVITQIMKVENNARAAISSISASEGKAAGDAAKKDIYYALQAAASQFK